MIKKITSLMAIAAIAFSTTLSLAQTKKDGTADKRYKKNKETAKTTTTVTHKKKDGTADMRYKDNKVAKPKQ